MCHADRGDATLIGGDRQRFGELCQICGDHLGSGGDHSTPPHEMIEVGTIGDACAVGNAQANKLYDPWFDL